MSSDAPGGVPPATFVKRRREVFERLGQGVLVLPGAGVQFTSRDTERRYVPDRELYYLTGLVEPESVAVLVGGDPGRLVLFVRDRDPEAELWGGGRLGPEGARAETGADECHPLRALESSLPVLLRKADSIRYRFGRGDAVERLVIEALAHARGRGSRSGEGPRGLTDPGEILDDLRIVKEVGETALIRHACAITVEGQQQGAASIRPGVGEWVVEAAVNAAFRASGATGPGFETIVGSGKNGCVLHYVRNHDVVADQSLVLVDAGAEYGLYHGDVTRTYPASGTFTSRQRAVYDIVEAGLEAGVAAARPGATIGAVHNATTRVLVEGLVGLGILEGEVDGLIEQGAQKPYYPHQTSHWLGLDVHDPGDYMRNGSSRELEPGMVFTVEPGLYFRPELVEGSGEPYGGIGVRVEDDVLITDSGCEVLTKALPTAADEVERLVGA